MNLWEDELTVSPKFIENYAVFKLEEDQKIKGYYAVQVVDRITMEIERLFVHPDYIRQGIGYRLLNHAIDFSRSVEKEIIVVESDPNAKDFYEKYGFKVVGKKESLISGRFLPVMSKRILSSRRGSIEERLKID